MMEQALKIGDIYKDLAENGSVIGLSVRNELVSFQVYDPEHFRDIVDDNDGCYTVESRDTKEYPYEATVECGNIMFFILLEHEHQYEDLFKSL